MLGARDVAFPRLNAFSYWAFLVGGIFLYSSFLLGGAPNGGWFGYAPNTSITFSPGYNIDFWVFGLQILGIASTTGAVNLVVTALNMRAPGMSLLRMPIFVWMSLIAQFLVLFAMPVITVALFLLMFDRQFGANFFNPAMGGDPVLWQHLFWIFGHPEVYILILPAMGVVSEIIPVFARKPLFGYPVMVFSGIAIGFMGWGVWVHHMFSTGLGPGGRLGLLGVDHVHRRAHGREDIQLGRNVVARVDQALYADALRHGLHRHVHHRRALRRDPRRVAPRPPADRHLLRRRPLPLRALRWSSVRPDGWLLLLVAQGLRLPPARKRSASGSSGSGSPVST